MPYTACERSAARVVAWISRVRSAGSDTSKNSIPVLGVATRPGRRRRRKATFGSKPVARQISSVTAWKPSVGPVDSHVASA